MTRLVKQVLTPIVGRLGTFVSATLVAQGVPHDSATQVAVAGGVLLAILWDVGIIMIAKRKTTA